MEDLATPDHTIRQITGYICPPPPIRASECQTIVVNVSELPNQQASEFNYAYMGQIWGLAFTSVLFLYLFCLGIGQILKLVRNA